ncbi:ADC synthase [Aspergillus alliaceus]|uniref:ADC synthase n=1 Tax=Petromyces alliaceus TaxID=209559 RepID=A0A5N7BUZ8_PETAA|nr:ADC synthase [Aspergillus alliaceus]
MAPSYTTITLTPGKADILETVCIVLEKHKDGDYYAYEREDNWHIGIGCHSSLLVDSEGKTVTVCDGSIQKVFQVHGAIEDFARTFASEHTKYGRKIFGQVGFNYAAHIRGIPYNAGKWPLLSMIVPHTEISFHQEDITVKGFDGEKVRELCDFIERSASFRPPPSQAIDTQDETSSYIYRVSEALSEISHGMYTKVIPSRVVGLKERVNMPATLFHGRRSNNPKRSFSVCHTGFQATGFSPELVMSVENGKVVTEPLAGTRSCIGADIEELCHELLNDPKEIVEHILSVKEAINELNQLCSADSIAVEDLMTVKRRGSVQHLGSRVTGRLSFDKDVWDAFNIIFPSVTASGIPKQAALEAIQRLESQPRELYAGAVFILEDAKSFEAALVLRTVFQDRNRHWIQAGAGIISQSNPERELTETSEKMASIAQFVVPETRL